MPSPFTTNLVGNQSANGHAALHNAERGALNEQIGTVVNVKNPAYAGGATGDGVADDTAAIIAAVAAASSGVVFFPLGTYVKAGSTQLNIPANVVLQGAGPGSIILDSGTSTSYFQINGSRAGIRNLTLKRGNSTVSRLLHVTGSDSIVENVYFDGQGATFTGSSLTVGAGGDHLQVKGCTFNTGNGNELSANGVIGLRIIGNRWEGHRGASWALTLNTNCQDFIIANNVMRLDATSTAAAIGLYTSGAGSDLKDGVVSNNYIEGPSTSIVVQLTAGGNAPKNITVSGNKTKQLANGASASAISISAAENITITGNNCDLNSFQLSQVIEVIASIHCTVTGNVLHSNGGATYGIMVNDSRFCTVSGNTVRAPRDIANGDGIRLLSVTANGCTDNTVTGNTVIHTVGGAAAGKCGIHLVSNNAAGHVDRNTVVGNVVFGDNASTSKGVSLEAIAGTVDRNLVGMNILRNVVTAINQSSDTNTLLSGTTWNLT